MERWLICILVLIAIIPFCLAGYIPITGDSQTYIAITGDSQAYTIQEAGDSQTNVFFTSILHPIVIPPVPTGGGGATKNPNATCLNHICEINEDKVCGGLGLATDCNGECDYNPEDPFSDIMGSPDCPYATTPLAQPTGTPTTDYTGIITMIGIGIAVVVLAGLLVGFLLRRPKREHRG